MASWVAIVVIIILAMLATYQIGHSISAHLVGDPGLSLHLYNLHLTDSAYRANQLSFRSEFWISIAGLTATQMAVIALFAFVGFAHVDIDARLALLLDIIYLIFVGSAVLQVFRAIIAPITPQAAASGVDLTHTLDVIHHISHLPALLLKAGLGMLTIIYVVAILWFFSFRKLRASA